MYNSLKDLVKIQKSGRPVGIYSACSANPIVIEAVLRRGLTDNSPVLIESTANQCNQYGGYTGMTPADFKREVHAIAERVGFDTAKLYLGGDHLGPLTFTQYDEEKAMKMAEELIDAYVSAGFTKIHIDTSMKVASDPVDERLADEVIAARGARLAKIAEDAFARLCEDGKDHVHPVYVVGSEVPIPGGATENNDTLQVTRPEDFESSVESFRQCFKKEGLEEAWDYVIAFVVQPGVEEQDAGCVEYDRKKAVDLMQSLKKYDNLVFEGHSTDYQTRYKLREMVEDGVGILKVGPGLTYAYREGLFALSFIEDELIDEADRSNLRQVLDEEMLKNPKNWAKHYSGTEKEVAIKRKYSFSDRSRYYYNTEAVEQALEKLFDNFKDGVTMNLLSQFMPIQYRKIRLNQLSNDPKSLVMDWVSETIDDYLYATRQRELI